MKCPNCETRFDGFDGKASNTCRACDREYCDDCIDSHEGDCAEKRLRYDIAEMIAEHFGRSVIEPDLNLADEIADRIKRHSAES